MNLDVETADTFDIVDLTDEIERHVPGSLTHGICSVVVQHTTAGIVVNEAESGLLGDIETMLESVVSDEDTYHHDAIDNNATAHLRSLLLGSSLTIPITDGSLDLGTWQRVLLIEGDGPRTRTVTLRFGESMRT